jgi:hypothetical protein
LTHKSILSNWFKNKQGYVFSLFAGAVVVLAGSLFYQDINFRQHLEKNGVITDATVTKTRMKTSRRKHTRAKTYYANYVFKAKNNKIYTGSSHVSRQVYRTLHTKGKIKIIYLPWKPEQSMAYTTFKAPMI